MSASSLVAQVPNRQVSGQTDAAAREGSVAGFAQALAREGVAAGAVLVRSDLRTPPPPKGPETVKQPTELKSALGTFRQAHPLYGITEANGVLLMALSASACLAPLQQEITNLRLSGPIYAMGYQVVRRVNDRLPAAPPALVRSGLGGRGAPSTLERSVSLYYQQISVKQAFDEIVRQAPGIVWGVVEDVDAKTGRPRCLLHWFTADGTAVTSDDLLGGR